MQKEVFNPIKFVVMLLIDYFRWTQLTPVIVVWGFALLMLTALIFVNYQEESFDLIAAVYQWVSGLPWLGDYITTWLESMADDEGSRGAGGFDIEGAILKVWGYLSLALMLIAVVVNTVWGPFKPMLLKRKLGIAALGCVAILLAIFAVYFANPSEFNGPLIEWVLSFGGFTLVLFVISAWCLSIAHLLGLLRRAVEESSLGLPEKPKPRYKVDG